MDLLHIFNLEKVFYLLGIEWFKGLGYTIGFSLIQE
jgi:hypothetical protein